MLECRPRTVAAIGLVVAAILYTSWPLASLLHLDASTPHSLVSELAATDQPWSWLFRLGDTSAGLVAIAAGVVAALRASGQWARAGYALLALFGAATIADASMPLACAPTATPNCANPSSDVAHVLTSGTSSVAVCVGIVLVLIAARSVVPPSLQVVGAVLAAVAIGALSLFSVRTLGDDYEWSGLIQRVGLLALSLLLAGCGLLVPRLTGPRR